MGISIYESYSDGQNLTYADHNRFFIIGHQEIKTISWAMIHGPYAGCPYADM